MKVHVVIRLSSDPYCNGGTLVAVYADGERAKKYTAHCNERDRTDDYVYEEWSVIE